MHYVYDSDGNRVITVENGVTTLYIGNYFEAELGTGTTNPVFFTPAGVKPSTS